MKTYSAEIVSSVDGVTTIRVGFGAPAQNDQIVRDAWEAMRNLGLTGGKGVKIEGPASLPVAMALAHAVAHLYGWVACFDPKLNRYVVAISHDPEVRPGDLLA